MKTLRLLTVVSVLAGLAVSQLPTSASCQMGMGLASIFCSMPCCTPLHQGYGGLSSEALAKKGRTHPAVPAKCPLIRPSVNQDAISPSTRVLSTGLEMAAAWGSAIVSSPIFKVSALRSVVESFTTLLIGTRPTGRAPPLDYILFSA
jgi:hypothetical protein